MQTLSDLAGRNTTSALASASTTHQSRHWPYAALTELYQRKFLFRNVALELFFRDGRSFLVTFAKDERAAAFEVISNRCPIAAGVGALNVAGNWKLSDAVLGPKTKLEKMTKKWERREVSNFDCESSASHPTSIAHT